MTAEDHDPALEPKKKVDKTNGQSGRDRLLDGLLASDVRTIAPDSISPENFQAFCEEHRTDHYLADFGQKWWDHWEQERSRGVLLSRKRSLGRTFDSVMVW